MRVRLSFVHRSVRNDSLQLDFVGFGGRRAFPASLFPVRAKFSTEDLARDQFH